MKTNFHFQPVNSVNRLWVKRLQSTIQKRFVKAGGDKDFIDNDKWLNERIIAKIFIPEDMQNVNVRYFSTIAYISRFFECTSVWGIRLVGNTEPIKTFSIWGHETDVKNAMRSLQYYIDTFNALQVQLQKDYRYRKKRSRHLAKPTNKIDSRVRAKEFVNDKVLITNHILYYAVDRQYSVLHHNKVARVEHILSINTKLDYKKYHYKRAYKLKDAYCKPGAFVNNRVIHEPD